MSRHPLISPAPAAHPTRRRFAVAVTTLLLAATGASLPAVRAGQVTATWLGDSSTGWGTASRWSLGVVPNNTANTGYDVILPAASFCSLDLDITVDSLDFGAGATLSGLRGLTVNGTTRVTATSAYLYDGFFAQSTAYRLGTLSAFDPGSGTLGAGNYVSYTSGGSTAGIGFRGADVIVNRASVALFGASASLVDQGTGADALRHLAVNAGTLLLAGGHNFTTAGDFSNPGTLRIGDDQYNLEQNSNLAVRFTVAGALTNYDAATRTLTSGTYQLDPSAAGAVLQFPGADIRQNAATIRLNDTGARIVDENGSDALARLTVNRGSLDAYGVGRAFTPDNGTFTNSGTLRGGLGNLTVNGNYLQTPGGRTELFPLSGLAASLTVNGNLAVQGGRLVLNDPYRTTGGSVSLVVNGTLATSAGSALSGRGTVSYLGRASLGGVVAPGVAVAELGDYDPTMLGSTVGRLEFQGALTLENDSELQIKLGGLLPDTGFDQLFQRDTTASTGGLLLAGGRLTLTLLAGFTPGTGDTFAILDADSLGGTFGNAGGNGRFEVFDPAGGDVGSFALRYGPGQATLEDFRAVPEPGGLALFGLAGIALVARWAARRMMRASA